MKSIYLLSLFLLVFVGCKNEESNDTYDFSLLGVEKIVMDNIVINTDAFGFPDVSDESITIIGQSNGSSIRSYELVVLDRLPEEETIHVQTKFDDTSIDISKRDSDALYMITITRNGYHEKLIYYIGFMVVPV